MRRSAPSPATTGMAARWTGAARPHQYGAIHFHDDDLHDAGWRPSLDADRARRTRAAASTRSGSRPTAGPEFWVVFYVRPPRRGPRGARGLPRLHRDLPRVLELPRAHARRAPPSSTSARCPSSTRPTSCSCTTRSWAARPTTRTRTARGSATSRGCGRSSTPGRPGRLWNLFLDFCLLDWLEAHGQSYDVITDDDLHAEGVALLDGYAVVLTGCHPEYYSREMLDALDGHLGARRPAHVHGRQRLLLARLVPGRATRPDRGAARRGRHSRLGGSGRRVLPQLHRRVRRALAAAGPRPERARRRGLRRPGLRPLVLLPAHRRPAATRARGSSSRASRTRSSATSASPGVAPPGSSSTPSTRASDRRRMRSWWPPPRTTRTPSSSSTRR